MGVGHLEPLCLKIVIFQDSRFKRLSIGENISLKKKLSYY